MENISNILLYNDGELELKVSFNEETIWLRQDEISLLFDVNRTSVTKHINKILKENYFFAVSGTTTPSFG